MTNVDYTSRGYIEVKDFAEHFGIGRMKVYELIWNDELRHVRIGRKILIPLDAVDEFVADHQSGPAA